MVGPHRPFVILVAKDRVIKRRPRTLYGFKDLSEVFLAFTTIQKWPLALLFNKSTLEFGLIMIQSRNFLRRSFCNLLLCEYVKDYNVKKRMELMEDTKIGN